MSCERQHVQAPIHPLMASRWSTRAFDARAVETEKLAACLEAARWAPSCYNDQPWRILVADRYHNHEAWQDLFDCLASGNQAWAQRAPVLLLACASGRFGHNGQPNRWGQYDAGQAMMALCLQATALGLVTHQMGGFDPEAARGKFEIPEDFSLMSVTALGYPGDPSVLEDEELRGRELSPRQRKPLEEVAWAGCFGQSFEPPAHAAWEARYQETPSEALPWYHPELDPDVAAALERLEVTGGRVLDLGTGPGTQAVALAKRGFQVVATDVSATALTGAAELASREGGRVHFVRDDILTTGLDEMFDLIVDRGIFHIFPPEAHADYLDSLDKLLEPGGYLLLKCFSHLETRPEGPPGRYSPEDIKRIFGGRFEVLDVRDSAFRRPDDNEPPKALFCVLRKRE